MRLVAVPVFHWRMPNSVLLDAVSVLAAYDVLKRRIPAMFPDCFTCSPSTLAPLAKYLPIEVGAVHAIAEIHNVIDAVSVDCLHRGGVARVRPILRLRLPTESCSNDCFQSWILKLLVWLGRIESMRQAKLCLAVIVRGLRGLLDRCW